MLRKPRKRKVSWYSMKPLVKPVVAERKMHSISSGSCLGPAQTKKQKTKNKWVGQMLRPEVDRRRRPQCRHMTNPAPTAVATCKQRRHSHEPRGRWWRRSWQPEASMQEQQHTRKANAISQTQYARQTRNVAWCLRNCQEETQQTNTCGCKSQGTDGTGLPDFPPVLSEPERRRKTAGLP